MKELERAKFDLEMILPYVEHLKRKVDMGKEQIRERTHPENHDGKRSETRRIQSAMAQLKLWRNERTASHEQGHFAEPPKLCYDNEPLEQHITIWTDPYLARLMEVRKELESERTGS